MACYLRANGVMDRDGGVLEAVPRHYNGVLLVVISGEIMVIKG